MKISVLRLTMSIASPWAVGDPTGLGGRDVVVLTDSAGRAEAPPTSLAGSLREHVRRNAEHLVVGLLGDDPRTGIEARDDEVLVPERKPSRLRFLGVRHSVGQPTRVVSRTTTAVDADTGSAHDRMLRTDEHVDGNTELIVYLTCDDGIADNELEIIASWAPVVGRHRTNGWGRAELTEIRHGDVDLTDRAQLLRWLCRGGPDLVDTFADQAVTRPEALAEETLVHVRFEVGSGVHIGTGELATKDGRRFSRTTKRTVDGVECPVVPATSWRGVVRSRCRYILGSLGVDRGRVLTLIDGVFGGPDRRGLLTFHDSPLDLDTRRVDHVAIDRVTGGARDKLLFQEEVAHGSVELRITTDRRADLPRWCAPMLGHVIRDLAEGFLGIGGRTTRGLGTLTIAEQMITPVADGIDVSEWATHVAEAA